MPRCRSSAGLAAHYGVTVASVIRMLMKREDDAASGGSVATRVRKRTAALAKEADAKPTKGKK